MARRKWDADSVAGSIVENALALSASFETGQFLLPDSLAGCSLLDLQSTAVRLGQFAWRRRRYADELAVLRDDLLAWIDESSAEVLSTAQQAYARVAIITLQALMFGDGAVVPWSDADLLDAIARSIIESDEDNLSIVDVQLARSLLEPLMSNRRMFRTLLGSLGSAIAALDAAGLDGRLPNLISLPAYQELRALQGVLNGILRASRTGAAAPAERELVGSLR